VKRILFYLICAAFAVFIVACAGGTPGISNQPPNAPSNPTPADNATDVSINITLSWACTDPDGDTLTYNVYFGTVSTPTIVATVTTKSYDPGSLNYNTKYYWKIVAKDGKGGQTSSPVWNFTTESTSNTAPEQPSNPDPTDNATDVPIDKTLSWTCTDPDGDSLTYDIYFGTSSNPPLVKQNHTSNTYNPGPLSYNTKYYWKIVAKDGKGGQTSSPVWNFTTESAPNTPPEQPSNPDPTDNATDVPIDKTLSWICFDPDGDSLTYDIYFGTSSNPPLVKQNHTSNTYNPGSLNYNTKYYWKIVAKDGKGGQTSSPVWNFTTKATLGTMKILQTILLTDKMDSSHNTGPIYSSPSISKDIDDFIYVGGQTNLYKLNNVGTSYNYVLPLRSASPVWSSPTIDYLTGRLYVGNNNGEVIIFDTKTETLFKTISLSDRDHYAIYSAPIVWGGSLYVIDAGGYLHKVSLDGTVIWSYMITLTYVRASPITDGTHLYIADSGGNIYAVNHDGVIEWYRSTNDCILGGFALDASGNVYVAGKTLWSFTPSGTLRWRLDMNSQSYGVPVISSDGKVYIGAEDGVLRIVNCADGSLESASDLGGPILSSCLIGDNDIVYVVSGIFLRAVNPLTGSTIDFVELNNCVESNMVLHFGNIYVADQSGYFYVVEALSDTISDTSGSWPMFQRNWYHTGM